MCSNNKAAEIPMHWDTPKRWRARSHATPSARFWSAAVLCRFCQTSVVPVTFTIALFQLFLSPRSLQAQHRVASSTATNEFIAPASNQGELAIKRFQVAPGLKVDLWAAEPMLANPVAFNFDEKGRAYVCETFRLGAGVDDIRQIMDWLDEELPCRTVDDRLAEMKRHLGERFRSEERRVGEECR